MISEIATFESEGSVAEDHRATPGRSLSRDEALIASPAYHQFDTLSAIERYREVPAVGKGIVAAGTRRATLPPVPNGKEDWLRPRLQDLRRMAYLPRGWNGYDAVPPNALALANAESFLIAAWEMAIDPLRVSPSVAKGVAITFEFKDRVAFIEAYNLGELYALLTQNGDEVDLFPFAADARSFREVLTQIRAFLRG